MEDNIRRILKYTGVPMRIFSVNFGPQQFNWTLSAAFAEGLLEDELKTVP